MNLGESFPTSIYLQKSASIQPRTSPSKFGGKFNSILFTRVLKAGNMDALLKALDEPKIKVDQKNPQGFSALMVAADKGNLEIATTLVNRGARVAAKDDDRETAVMKAAAKGYSWAANKSL